MNSRINVESIRAGDRVKISLYGLPESGWLEVTDVYDRHTDRVRVLVPNGLGLLCDDWEITAHEPAAPALPDWWGSKVILDEGGYGVFIGGGYVFPLDSTHVYGPDEVEDRAVLVIVDRDGNLPTARVHPDAYAREQRWREQAEAERDKARADLAAFRAEVAKVRDSMPPSARPRKDLTAILDRADHVPRWVPAIGDVITVAIEDDAAFIGDSVVHPDGWRYLHSGDSGHKPGGYYLYEYVGGLAEHDRAVLYRLAEHFDRMGEGTDWQDSWEWRAAEEVRDYAARLTEKEADQ